MKALALNLSLLAVLLAAGPQPLASCPTDTLVVCGLITTSTAPSYSAIGCVFNNSGAIYDLVSGYVSVGATLPSADVRLITEDIYTITGPSSVGPIAFSANLAVRAGIENRGSVIVEIRSSGGEQVLTFDPDPCGCIRVSYQQNLSLPLAHAVGEPFPLVLDLQSSSPGGRLVSEAVATGNLGFALPPGYTVTSCQGYSTAPTVTRTVAWGRLKAIYR